MKNTKKLIVYGILIILIVLMNAGSYVYFYIHFTLHKEFAFICRLLYSLLFYFLQFFLLYYAERSTSKLIYFFPFHWGIEIWRIFCMLGAVDLTRSFNKKFYHFSNYFWAGDWFPATLTPYITLKSNPTHHIRLEVIIKLFISFMALSFSMYEIIQRKKNKICKEIS